MLVLNSSNGRAEIVPEIAAEGKQKQLNEAFEKWLKEVEELPISPSPVEGDYRQHIIEKYRKQGLEICFSATQGR